MATDHERGVLHMTGPMEASKKMEGPGERLAGPLDEAKFVLWFFRDLSDEQRLALFRLHGMPVDEIGQVHGHQRKALKHIFAAKPEAAPVRSEDFQDGWDAHELHVAMHSEPPEAAPVVGALEWERITTDEGESEHQHDMAKSSIGTYIIDADPFSYSPTTAYYVIGPDSYVSQHTDVVAAKAAAQADYESRIRSALLAPVADTAALPRDDTGRITSDYEPSALEIEVIKGAIRREFGINGTDGYYIRILKALAACRQPDTAALDALRRIAQPPSCGCVSCTGQCRSQEALEIELEAIRDLARAALSHPAAAKGGDHE